MKQSKTDLNSVYRISYSSNQGGSQVSLITITFCFFKNEFAFTVQVKHKSYINSWLHSSISVFYDWPFPHVYFAKNEADIIFPFNSRLSFQRLCRLLWGRLKMGGALEPSRLTEIYAQSPTVPAVHNEARPQATEADVLSSWNPIYKISYDNLTIILR